MGCDIHIYTEYKKDGKWHNADHWEPSDYDPTYIRIPWRFRCYEGRDYSLFSFLANVRNNTWGNQVPVLSDPRGLPADLSERLQQEFQEGGYHSLSFFTLDELTSGWKAKRSLPVTFDAVVHSDDPKTAAWLELPEETRGAPPSGYCASSNGKSAVNAKWTETMQELVGPGVGRIIEFLRNLSLDRHTDDSDVRIVFGFDS